MAGRPKKSDSEVRSKTLRIRLTAGEREMLNQAAGTKSLETSSWARAELLALAQRTLRPDGGDQAR